MIRINAGAGDDSGQGFALPEEVSKSNRVKTSARGGRCPLPCWNRGWVTRQEDSAGGKLKSLKWESVKDLYQLVSFLSRLVCPEQEKILIEKIMREVYVYKRGLGV